ncbi:MAG: hypothetical protein U5R30_00415, partial [Deltaproteobacteria bacterium]|nr:hypothetical protein [Deltaproteobacteria bacterium]
MALIAGAAWARKFFDDYLRGQSGGRQVEVNTTGQVVGVLESVPATQFNVYLTIDAELRERPRSFWKGSSVRRLPSSRRPV